LGLTPVIATIWLDNPPLNVLSQDVLDAVRSGLTQLGDARVAVLRGRGGRAFSAGGDLASFREYGSGSAVAIQALADLIESVDVPVIAAIEGYCLGGGLEVALACDVRIAQAGAQLGFPEVGLGLIPGGGGTQRAPRLIGGARATWLLMSGERISAAEAYDWGLVQSVVDDLDAAVERVAATLTAQSPRALRELKRLLLETRDVRSDRAEQEAFARCLDSLEGREGMAAFFEKRRPSWAPSP
jgi:enoyl-CoA hydratase/carnithine racemase